MELLKLINDNYKTISIIGMAKNTGKTITLNYLVNEAIEANIPIGITSIGRDGEGIDIVTDTEKPRIYVDEGMIIATSTGLLPFGDANIEILQVTNYRTPLGEILIGRVKSPGNIQITGPQSLKELKELTETMINYGAKFVIVDGALDRKSSAAPSITDATILSTGAVISRDMNKVIEETMHLVNTFSLPTIEDNKLKNIVEDLIDNNKIAIIDKDYNVNTLNFETALGVGSQIGKHLKDNSKYLVIPGSLVKSTIEDLVNTTRKYENIEIIIHDGTKIFISPRDYLRFVKLGVNIKVLHPINLIAITINPYAPSGYYFEPNIFLKQMKSYINSLKVMDLMLGGD